MDSQSNQAALVSSVQSLGAACYVQTLRQHPMVHDASLWSQPPFDQFNLALHVGDHPVSVQANRHCLLAQLQPYGLQRLVWLNQTHSTTVVRVDRALSFASLNADALVTDQRGVGLVIMTADCLPIVLTDVVGCEVAVLHAGWRGLVDGVIEATVAAMRYPAQQAWLGAAIGATAFEVGDEVRTRFIAHDPTAAQAFIPQSNGQYLADLYALARLRLVRLGINLITGGERCTLQEAAAFYSYRRDGVTGRMATVAFLPVR
ncbi:MAG: peptidoglycan editing factor PgeF [Pseudomonadota bacterium]|nr:peptidoglycan editing factor PgeF [Pseudomonadota bacterium]